MRYRAVLIVPNATRDTKPYQSIGNILTDLEDWARKVLPKAPEGSEVVIYESIEKPVARFTRDLTGTPVQSDRGIVSAARAADAIAGGK